MSPLLLASIFALLSCLSEPIEALRILAIFPLNSKSHDVVCDSLARGLAARGHHIDVYSVFSPKKNTLVNYKHHIFDSMLPEVTNNMSYEQAVNIKPQGLQKIMDTIGIPACRQMDLPIFQQLLKNSPRYDVVIVEGFITDCYLAWGRHLNLPMIGIMPTAVMDWYIEELGNPFNPAVTPVPGSSVFSPMSFLDRLRNVVTSIASKFLFTRVIRDQNKLIERYFGPGYPDIVELRHDLDLLIVNSHHAFDGIRPFTAAIVPAAGIHIDDEDDTKLPEDVQKWLDHSEHGCVYISFGSMILVESFPEPIIKAIYASFRNIAPVQVLMKVANPENLPIGVPENVMTKTWFPQLQVLKHKNTKVFVTHGGLMSIQESVHSGVPMVSIPVFGDQFGNAEMNARKGIARSVQLKDIDEEKLTEALRDVLHNSSFKRNVEKLSRLFVDRPMKPLDTAVYWVEYVARHGKKCLRSPIVDMRWWQANLLDVYAFVAVIIIGVLLVVKLVVKSVYRRCCSRKKISSSTKVKSKKTQ